MPELNCPDSISVHRNRDGQEGYYVFIKCKVAPDTPVTQAHQLSKELEQELSRRLESVVEVLVHLEPTE